jgi:hypothetical protein
MSFFAPQSLPYINFNREANTSSLVSYQHTDTPSPALEGVKSLRCHRLSLLVLVADSWFGKNPVCHGRHGARFGFGCSCDGVAIQCDDDDDDDDDDDTKRAAGFHFCPHTGLMFDILCHGDF